MQRKHLSSFANHLLQASAQQVGKSDDELVDEFEHSGWKFDCDDNAGSDNDHNYSRKLVEYCAAKAVADLCRNIEERISDGSFSRFTFDMMLAWETPAPHDDDHRKDEINAAAAAAHNECRAKERSDDEKNKMGTVAEEQQQQDDTSLFYSDLMPLLVDNEPSVGEDAFVWLASLVPLLADVSSARFTFETLTAPTANKLHFPAHDKFLREIDNTMKYLLKQAKPKGVELTDDEYILHVEGTATTQRVVRHIGGTSWPGRLTLTNYALYFEASGVISYEDAVKIDLSKDMDQSIKPTATGPWGAPLFDKAIVYESPELSEGIVLEFPEITSSIRRDHWMALTKEVMLMHKFLSKFNVKCTTQAWEMHAKTILGIIRLHSAREMLRISPPDPKKFLIFTLFDEVPKGDYVLEELAESLKKANSTHPCSASVILRNMNLSLANVARIETEVQDEVVKASISTQDDDLSSLETAVNTSRTEAKRADIAKATTQRLKDEGFSESVLVLMELLKPLKNVYDWFLGVISWEKPGETIIVFTAALIIVYKEWVNIAISCCLLWVVGKMVRARKERIKDKQKEFVVCTASDQTAREAIVSAQYGLITFHELLQKANITILKLHSLLVSRAPKQADMVMVGLSVGAVLVALIPVRFVLVAAIVYFAITTSKVGKIKNRKDDRGSRRLKEWWDSIPVIPLRITDDPNPEGGSGS